jgi:hypothetical protein
MILVNISIRVVAYQSKRVGVNFDVNIELSKLWIVRSLFILLLCGVYSNVIADDDKLECYLCHKHRGLSRVDEDGNLRVFYINEELFKISPHSRNECKDCHRDIDQIPHEVPEKVDCTQECHVVEPCGPKKFSHKPMAKKLEQSVHSRHDKDGILKPHQEDYPGCKDCHDMPLYRPLSFFKGEQSGVTQRGIARCKGCHEKGNFAESFYNHVTSRLHKTRKPSEWIRVCAKCHDDEELTSRHDIDRTIESYKETFHYKMIALGSEETPDCIDCHVVLGESPHLIESKKVATSSVYENNVATTCRSEGCHEKAGPNLAGYQTHVSYDRKKYPLQFYMLIFFKSLLACVMYFFLTLIFLELLRRLFPDFSFNKDEWAIAKARKKKS